MVIVNDFISISFNVIHQYYDVAPPNEVITTFKSLGYKFKRKLEIDSQKFKRKVLLTTVFIYISGASGAKLSQKICMWAQICTYFSAMHCK